MSTTLAEGTALAAAWQRVRRWLGRWWVHQPAASQDRFVTLAPLASVLLFLAAIISAFWYLRNEEIDRETEAVKRDTEIAQQQIRLRLIENQEQLVRMARELVARVRALLRRQAPGRADAALLRFDGLSIDLLRREVMAEGGAVSLTGVEFRLLAALARARAARPNWRRSSPMRGSWSQLAADRPASLTTS